MSIRAGSLDFEVRTGMIEIDWEKVESVEEIVE